MGPPPKKKQRRDGPARNEESLPQKKFFRQRAHANPFSDHALKYPPAPSAMDWAAHYPKHFATEPGTTRGDASVEIADIGCGFGGLLFALAPQVPDTLILGMEIRGGVAEYVSKKISAVRARNARGVLTGSDLTRPLERSEQAERLDGAKSNPESVSPLPDRTETERERTGKEAMATPEESRETFSPTHSYSNISVLRANAMKFLPNFFHRAQLRAIFFCFPDPHFKARKHKARIVSPTLNAEYAFVLRPGGLVYTITDVQDLHEWMCDHLGSHESFERVAEAEYARALRDAVPGREEDEMSSFVRTMMSGTEEGQKVTRNQGEKFVALFRRMPDPAWP